MEDLHTFGMTAVHQRISGFELVLQTTVLKRQANSEEINFLKEPTVLKAR